MNTEKIVFILGSSRSFGDTRKIIDSIMPSLNADLIDLNDNQISYYDYEHRNKDDDFIGLIHQILNYNTIVFATPVYWYSMSAILKTFIDRLSDLLTIEKDLGRQLRGKSMLLLYCSSDNEDYPEFYMPFKRTAEYLGMHYKGHINTWVENDKITIEVQGHINEFINKFG